MSHGGQLDQLNHPYLRRVQTDRPAVAGRRGDSLADLHDELVRNLDSRRIQVDEIWSFVGCKEKSRKEGKAGAGDAWTWCAIDADAS